jgi:histidinol phosphatase-like enzyme
MRSPYSPLPGSGPPVRGLFIDRWGTLLDLPEQGFLSSFEDARFTPGAIDAMFHAGQAGWNLYLIGNESAIPQGKLPLETWQAFEQALLDELRSHGVAIQRSYACTDHPEGVPPHTKDSVYLLPNTGGLYHAAQVDGINLDQSWVIGDSSLELVAGWRASCRLAGVRTGQGVQDGLFPIDPEIFADDLASVLLEVTSDETVHRR